MSTGQASGCCGFLGLCWSWQWKEALGSQGFTGPSVSPSLGSTSSLGAFLLEVPPEVRLEDKSHPVAPLEPLSFPLGSFLLTPSPGPAFWSHCSNICSAHQCLSPAGPSPWIRDNFLPQPGSTGWMGLCWRSMEGVCV